MSEIPALNSILELKYPQQVSEFETYEAAQSAVDFLSDNDFPVQNLCIVGTNLKLIERVTGRRTWGNVLGQGALSGVGTGLLVGLMLAFFTTGISYTQALLVGLGLGILIGLVTSALGYSLSGGRRDFNSVRQTVATRYELLAEHNVAAKAKEVLTQRPGARAAMFE